MKHMYRVQKKLSNGLVVMKCENCAVLNLYRSSEFHMNSYTNGYCGGQGKPKCNYCDGEGFYKTYALNRFMLRRCIHCEGKGYLNGSTAQRTPA